MPFVVDLKAADVKAAGAAGIFLVDIGLRRLTAFEPVPLALHVHGPGPGPECLAALAPRLGQRNRLEDRKRHARALRGKARHLVTDRGGVLGGRRSGRSGAHQADAKGDPEEAGREGWCLRCHSDLSAAFCLRTQTRDSWLRFGNRRRVFGCGREGHEASQRIARPRRLGDKVAAGLKLSGGLCRFRIRCVGADEAQG